MAAIKVFPILKAAVPLVPKVGLLAAGAYAGYRCWSVHRLMRRAAYVREFLCESDDLAEDFVVNSEDVRSAWMADYLAECEVKVSVESNQDDGGSEDPPLPSKQPKLAESVVKYNAENREVVEHMVVDHKKRYMRSIIAEAKVRFGKPERTGANLLAVRKFAGDAMRKHRVRPTHVARMLPLVVECVFMESDSERDARKLVEAVQGVSGAKWWRTLNWMVGGGYVDPSPHLLA